MFVLYRFYILFYEINMDSIIMINYNDMNYFQPAQWKLIK
jgi:hypothetical protein